MFDRIEARVLEIIKDNILSATSADVRVVFIFQTTNG